MEINYRRASTMGIPLVRLPVDPLNIAWQILESPLWRLLDCLPVNWGAFGRYSRRGWHFHDKAASHLHYGPVALPGHSWLLEIFTSMSPILTQFMTSLFGEGIFCVQARCIVGKWEWFYVSLNLMRRQSCWKSTVLVSPRRVGQTGHAIGKCLPRPSTRVSWDLSGMSPYNKRKRCCKHGRAPSHLKSQVSQKTREHSLWTCLLQLAFAGHINFAVPASRNPMTRTLIAMHCKPCWIIPYSWCSCLLGFCYFLYFQHRGFESASPLLPSNSTWYACWMKRPLCWNKVSPGQEVWWLHLCVR